VKDVIAALVGAAASTLPFVAMSALDFQPKHFGYLVYLVPATLLFGIGYLSVRAHLGLPARLRNTLSLVGAMIPWLVICTVFFFGSFEVSGSLTLLGRGVVYTGVALVNWWLFRSELEKQKASI
jgi:hypothetical protein